MKYAFMQAHQIEFRLTSMCRVLKVHRSGYYAWLREPLSPRAKANETLTSQIRACPPEDVGGAPDDEDFLAALAEPNDPEHDSLKE